MSRTDYRLFVRENDIDEYRKLICEVKLDAWLWDESIAAYQNCQAYPFDFTLFSSNIVRGGICLSWDFFNETPPQTLVAVGEERVGPCRVHWLTKNQPIEYDNLGASVLPVVNPEKKEVSTNLSLDIGGSTLTAMTNLIQNYTAAEPVWSSSLLTKIKETKRILLCDEIGSFGGQWPANLILSQDQLLKFDKFVYENTVIRGLYWSLSGQQWKEINLFPSIHKYRVQGKSNVYESMLNLAY